MCYDKTTILRKLKIYIFTYIPLFDYRGDQAVSTVGAKMKRSQVRFIV